MNYIENLKLTNMQAVAPKVNTSPVSTTEIKTAGAKSRY